MMDAGDLKTIAYDHTSGAREIAERALTLLQRAATTSGAETPAVLLDELGDLAAKVVRSKPEMAPVLQTLNRFFLAAEGHERDARELGPFRLTIVSLLQEHVRDLRASLDRVAANAQPLIQNGAVLVTHSRSSTVLAALRLAKQEGKLFDVVVPESRPLLEGRTLARELADDQIPVRLVVDALLGTAVEGADRILIGADAVTRDGVVNKAGTRLLALAAKAANVPVTLLAESTKTWVRTLDPQLGLLTGRPHDPKEVWDTAPRGVEVVNLYFDRTPLEAVAEIVDEDGVHTPATHWERVRSRGYARRLADAFPGELA